MEEASCGAASPGNVVLMCMIRDNCACFRAKSVAVSGQLPPTHTGTHSGRNSAPVEPPFLLYLEMDTLAGSAHRADPWGDCICRGGYESKNMSFIS